jgi:hypothetical protein
MAMRKKGFTNAGAQRWRCDACSLSSTTQRADLKRMAEFRAFLAWVTGKESLSEAAARLGVVRQTFASRIAWCWNVSPRIAKGGPVHRYVEVDGTYLPYGWCLLIASGEDGRPIAWQWCERESKAAYRRLFMRIREPGVLVSDGGAGCLAVARERWKRARIQRCLVHVLRSTRTDLTNKPRSGAGRELLKLARRLTKIRDGSQAAAWLVGLNRWHDEHGAFIKERTHAKDDPLHARGRKWWWTHERVRRAYYRFIRLQRDRTLFTFLEPGLVAAGPIPSTTNQLEGGINAVVKRVMQHHRGLSESHMRRACEWAIIMLASHPDPESFVMPEAWSRTTPPERHDTEPTPGTETAVQLPAPGINAYESGFGIRKGWAGHT